MTIFANRPEPFEFVDWYLVRDTFVDAADTAEGFTLGEIRYGHPDAQRAYYTVEDQDRKLEEGNGKVYGRSAIPTGKYRLTICQSPSRGDTCLAVNAVAGFSDVQIHCANKAEELRGCIAPGVIRTLDGVGGSRIAMVGLITELRKLNMRETRVYLNVMRA